MQKRDAATLLEDIEHHALAASGFVSGIAREHYRNDLMMRFAVERALEIAGEALKQLEIYHPALASRIPESRVIIGFRNVLAHGYAELDDARIHAAASLHATELTQAARLLLR